MELMVIAPVHSCSGNSSNSSSNMFSPTSITWSSSMYSIAPVCSYFLPSPRRLSFIQDLFVFLSVCPSVCLSITSRKDCQLNLHENLAKDVRWAQNMPLNFASHSRLGPVLVEWLHQTCLPLHRQHPLPP